jgi:hypothetical protein
MARIVDVPGLKNLIGGNFDKINLYMCNNGLNRYTAWMPKYDALRQSRQQFTVPSPDSHIPRGGSFPFNLSTYQVLVPGSTSQYTVTPVGQDHIVYTIGDFAKGTATLNFIHIQYDIKSRKVTNIYEYSDNGDTWFNNHIGPLGWAIGNAALNVATAGASSVMLAADNGAVSVSNGGSVVGAVASVGAAYVNAPVPASAASAASGAAVNSAVQTGGSQVADFGLDSIEYSDAMDSFNFSDGEGLSALSDAQNVSYGFDSPDIFGQIPDGTFEPDAFADDFSVTPVDFGATPEPSGFFGTSPGVDSVFNKDNLIDWGGKVALPVAVKVLDKATVSKPISTVGGGTKNSQSKIATSGTAKAVVQAGSAPLINQGVGLIGQIESMFSHSNNGQLKPNTGKSSAPIAGSSTNFYLIIGVALIGFAIIVKGK